MKTELPFNGEISRFFKEDADPAVRQAIRKAGKKTILTADYPYQARLAQKEYEATLYALQIELVKLQSWIISSGARIAVVFEGRDAAGKGGTIKRFRAFLNPRSANVVALSKPTKVERSQWYYQRYINHLPTGGQITFFDRSWYNRGVIEHVFNFCNHDQRQQFFDQTPDFEAMLANDGIKLFKIWLNVGQAEQMRRFLRRERDPLKQWKLSSIDVKGLPLWDAYSSAIAETFERTHNKVTPWTIIRADDKRRARIAAIRSVLHNIDYDRKDHAVACAPDNRICGGIDIWHA